MFLQPGVVVSDRAHGRFLIGAALGLGLRVVGPGGVYGLNVFHDRNWIEDQDWKRTIVHERVSVGADWQGERSRLSVNWYYPLSDDVNRFGPLAHYREYATGGVDVRYRRFHGERWSSDVRVSYERDRRFAWPGLFPTRDEDGLAVAVGLTYRLGCASSVGVGVERDFLADRTTPMVTVGLLFGPGVKRGSCPRRADTLSDRLLAFVEREKVASARRVVSPYVLTLLPDDVTKLFAVRGGDEDSDTVWIYSQGGPTEDLQDAGELKRFAGTHEDDTGERPLLVNVHQIQTLNPGLLERTDFYALPQVLAEVDLTIEILDRVIRHFKALGKRVVVFGHSYGAFVMPRYLMLKGPSAADAYVIMAGRMDIEERMYRNRFRNLHDDTYYVLEYATDGVTIVEQQLTQEQRDRFLVNGRVPLKTRYAGLYQGLLGQFRYTRELAQTDLSKVVYAYGTRDAAVGRLTDAEVRFLRSRGASVLAVSARNGSHGSMVDDPAARREILRRLANILP